MKNVIATMVVFMMVITLFGQQTVEISSESKVKWTGEKAIGTHWGYLDFSSGELVFKEGKLIGGSFVVDMNSLQIKDTDNKKIEKHIKSDDLFDIEKYPIAKLKFKEVKFVKEGKYSVKGAFTIKNKTKDLNFTLIVSSKSAKTSFGFDRQRFGIKMKNSIKDIVLYDEIKLEADLRW